jgi:hypothetical protein
MILFIYFSGKQRVMDVDAQKPASTSIKYFSDSLALDVNYSKQVQHNEDDGDDDQSVNPTPRLWKPWTYTPTEKAEQPQYD